MSHFARFQETCNEVIVLVATYPLFCFTPWLYDLDRRIDVGWCLVGCILLVVVFNISVLLYKVVSQKISDCKHRKARKLAKQNFERKKEEKRFKELAEAKAKSCEFVNLIQAKLKTKGLESRV